MIKNQISANSHVWEKWDWVWHTISYSMLILQAILFVNNTLNHAASQTVYGLSALLAIWYFPLLFKRESVWVNHPPRTLAYLLSGWVLWYGLVPSHLPSLMLAALFFPIMFTRLPIRWAVTGTSIAIVGLVVVSITFFDLSVAIYAGIFFGSSIVIGLFINSLINQSHERQKLIDELSQTRASLLKVEREAGTLAERQRLAREIHDTLAQDFTSVIMHLTAAQLGDSSFANSHIQQAEQTAREGLSEARRIVWAMRPEQLEHSSLVESIEGLAARWSAENSVSVNIVITGASRPLGPEKDAALLRVTQEALHNIMKHAKARRVDITLSYMSDLVALDIVDDGTGFVEKNHHGFGLMTMRERVEELNGTLTIESQLKAGTAIAISLPTQEHE